MTPTSLLAPAYLHMLGAVSQWLDKAHSSARANADALLSARLAPDMFPLATQIRFACVQAYEGMFRLAGMEFPLAVEALLAEGRNAESQPGTLADAKARIDETIAVVQSMAENASPNGAENPIAHSLPMGIVFDFTAEQYARDWAIGQFYFHVMTAYAILRNQGIDLGKADYVGHLFPYVRPGTMPQR